MNSRGKRMVEMLKQGKSGTSESNIAPSQFGSRASKPVGKASSTESSQANNCTTKILVPPSCSKQFLENIITTTSEIDLPQRITKDCSFDFELESSESNIAAQFNRRESNIIEKASVSESCQANNNCTESLVLPSCSKQFSENIISNTSGIELPQRSTDDYTDSEDDDDSVKDKTWDPNPTSKKQQNFDSFDSDDPDVTPMPEETVHVENESVTSSNQSKEKHNRKRSRWSKSNPSEWDKNIAKQRRYACLPYATKKEMQEAKFPRPVDCKKCRFKCLKNFNENNRQGICKMFWGLLNYQRQKDFILKHVNSSVPCRPSANVAPNKRRACSRSFHFVRNCIKIRVCQIFFQKTLFFSNGPINTAFKGQTDGTFVENDKRGKKYPPNKTKADDVEIVKQHIQMFTTMQYLDCKLSIN
ncbi:unnamed protein product [Psylliodes chrysocephalus]|uniref:Uncharacterized protein n=1 Tax=Psylliodes chrysocephalus TaxID=3402493 RepID=A0A9P0D289_9CUCU|nr:unnamed protein product [Psylliodes chrysocephala]